MKILKKPYYNNCVNWNRDEVDCLEELIDNGNEITRDTFLRYADRDSLREIEEALGYNRAFPMSTDWAVSYYSHAETGIKYFVHSAIEYVFASEDQIEKLRQFVADLNEEQVVSMPSASPGPRF